MGLSSGVTDWLKSVLKNIEKSARGGKVPSSALSLRIQRSFTPILAMDVEGQ